MTSRVLRPVLWGAGVLVALVLACEALGWPFLVGPLQQQLAKALQRDVSFSDGPQGEGGHTTIRLLGRLRLKSDTLRVAAPEWSRDPYFLDVKALDLALPYSAIWQALHGEQVHIVRLHAGQLNVMAERMKDGRASWQIGEPKPEDEPGKKLELPRFDSLVVREGQVVYRDEPLVLDLDARIHTVEGGEEAASSSHANAGPSASESASGAASAASDAAASGTSARGLVIAASGHYKKGRFDGRLTSSGALPLLGGSPEPVPLLINFRSSQTSFAFKGVAANALALDGITGEFRFKGPSLGDVSDLLNVTLPTTPPFDLAGRMRQQGKLWNVVVDSAKVGASSLQAQLQYDGRPKRPRLSGRLVGQRVLLADLAPSIGGETHTVPADKPRSEDGKALPDREFDLPSLRAMDANVVVDVQDMELGRVFAQPLRPLHAHLTLQDGVLTLTDLYAQTAGGRLQGDISLDGRGNVAQWKTRLGWADVDLARWFKQTRSNGAPPFIAGKLYGQARLTGQGKSTSTILGSLHGSLSTSLRDGTVSHLVVEAAGIDIAQALGVLVKGDDSLPVTCGVADFRADKGVLRPRAVLLDTKDSTVVVDGSISLASEKLDLRAQVEPKDKSPLALRAPILVKGTLADPKVSLEASKLAPRAGLAALLALINPIAAVIPLIDLGEGEKVSGCEAFMARQKAEGSTPARVSRDAPVPRVEPQARGAVKERAAKGG